MKFENFSQFGEKVAVYTEKSEAKTYLDLMRDIESLTTRLGAGRKLVFLHAARNYSTIVCYLTCLNAGHPVLMLDGPVGAHAALHERFRPNITLDCTSGEIIAAINNVHHIRLHPDLSLLLTTSGSAGLPKLVKLTLPNLAANATSIIKYLGLTETDTGITSLNLSYSYGLSLLNTHLTVGAAIVLTDASVSDSMFWHLVDRHKVTNCAGVPHQFEVLKQIGHRFGEFPSIKLITSAGGKLEPDTARHFISQAQENGARFFIMYGQTEASPRISYLPPELAMENADCIGVPIPGGHIALVDENDIEITDANTIGELAYVGPNVMMGYAVDKSDLALPRSTHTLKTGDLAICQTNGVYKITGRKERFIKLFGIRFGLDDVASHYTKDIAPCAVVGDDTRLIVIFEAIENNRCTQIREQIAMDLKISRSVVGVETVSRLPRLANGKINHASLKQKYLVVDKTNGFWLRFAQNFVLEWKALFGRSGPRPTAVKRIFELNLDTEITNDHQSFADLSGNSLNYVAVAIDLETYLGELPDDWHILSIHQLEALALPKHTSQI